MEFKSVVDIKNYFGIDESDVDGIRKKLRQRQKELHPDSNDREFVSKEAESEFHDIERAKEFLDSLTTESSVALVPIDTVHELIKVIRDIVPKEPPAPSDVQVPRHMYVDPIPPLEARLSEQFQQHVADIKLQSFFPKLTVSAVTLALSILWAFPSLASEHPILKNYINVLDARFSIVWGASIAITAVTWLVSKSIENRERQFRARMKTETYQNYLLQQFIKEFIQRNEEQFYVKKREQRGILVALREQVVTEEVLRILEKAARTNSYSTILDELRQIASVDRTAEYLYHELKFRVDHDREENFVRRTLERSITLSREALDLLWSDTLTADELLKRVKLPSSWQEGLKAMRFLVPKDEYVRYLVRRSRDNLFLRTPLMSRVFLRIWHLIFGDPDNIDLELAQTIANVTFARAEQRGLVVRVSEKTLSDSYSLDSALLQLAERD